MEVAEDLQIKLAENREVIAEGIRKLGFAQVDFDEEGFVSGKLNRVIDGVNAEKWQSRLLQRVVPHQLTAT